MTRNWEEYLVEGATAIQTPINEAIIFASIFGLVLGALVAAVTIGTTFVRKKLHIRNGEVLKWLAIFASISIPISIVFLIGILLWEPNIAVRQEIFNRHLEVLGYGLFFTLTFIGMLIASFLERYLLRRLIKAMGGENNDTE
jgi:sterol desaturase/sphingolipid hydroxylase (fatty acid hydroxylase superfamily)